jgi:arginase
MSQSFTGVGFDEIMSAMKIFLGSRKAVGLSVAEVNPDHDPGLVMTSRLIDELVASLENRLMSSDEKLGSR